MSLPGRWPLPDLVASCGIVVRERRYYVQHDHLQIITEGRPTTGECPRATNDQPIHPGTRSFVYADDLAVTTQSTEFAPIEETLTSALVGLSEYYTSNQLRANPTKTQVSLFHLRNRECGKQLKISWNGVNLTHCNLPVYIGVTLDRTLSYKAHIEKTKKKVGTRNSIIRKLRNSKWGATPTTLRSSALALCYSAAEYACPVWERSTQAKKLNATLNETCRMITGCLKPTNINSLPILAGIAPSDIRRAVASRTERTRQTMDERHPLNGHLGVVPRLKSRKSFITCTEPINTTAKAVRLELWRERLEPLDASVHLNISADEHLPAGADYPCWTTWKALNRLRTQVGRSRVNTSNVSGQVGDKSGRRHPTRRQVDSATTAVNSATTAVNSATISLVKSATTIENGDNLTRV